MTWLTARELAGLPGCPALNFAPAKSSPAWRFRAARVPAAQVVVASNTTRHPLPAETRAALAARVISTSGSKALALVEQAPVVSFAPPAPPPSAARTAAAPAPGPRPPATTRQGLRRCTHGADQPSCSNWKPSTARHKRPAPSGVAPGERRAPEGTLQATARAASQRARGDLVSARTLERYLSIYRAEGWWGLLPAPASVAASTHVDQDVAAVLGLYHSATRASASSAARPRSHPPARPRDRHLARPVRPCTSRSGQTGHVSRRGERGAHQDPPQRERGATYGCPSKARHQQPYRLWTCSLWTATAIQGQGTPPRPWRALRSLS